MIRDGNEKQPITTWPEFTRLIRTRGCLLDRLDEFPHAVLVTGCQRSGTTMMARIITQSEGMTNYWFGQDDELDAALILAGEVEHLPAGRYCFQTTYMDECYREYFEHTGPFKIIWVLRNPYSVVYSLMYNWAPRSLDGTFAKLATNQLNGLEKWLYRWLGMRSVSRVRRASYIYTAKTNQLFELFQAWGRERIFIVDYDELVLHKETIMPQIYRFIDLHYDNSYCQQIHSKSVDKKSKLTRYERSTIKMITESVYYRGLGLKNEQMPAVSS